MQSSTRDQPTDSLTDILTDKLMETLTERARFGSCLIRFVVYSDDLERRHRIRIHYESLIRFLLYSDDLGQRHRIRWIQYIDDSDPVREFDSFRVGYQDGSKTVCQIRWYDSMRTAIALVQRRRFVHHSRSPMRRHLDCRGAIRFESCPIEGGPTVRCDFLELDSVRCGTSSTPEGEARLGSYTNPRKESPTML